MEDTALKESIALLGSGHLRLAILGITAPSSFLLIHKASARQAFTALAEQYFQGLRLWPLMAGRSVQVATTALKE